MYSAVAVAAVESAGLVVAAAVAGGFVDEKDWESVAAVAVSLAEKAVAEWHAGEDSTVVTGYRFLEEDEVLVVVGG